MIRSIRSRIAMHPRCMRLGCAVRSLLFGAVLSWAPLVSGAQSPVSFHGDIRPLLNAHCLKCHGGVKEAANLNLGFRDSAFKGGKSGLPAIVPGRPEASELIARLKTTDEDDRMPKQAEPL